MRKWIALLILGALAGGVSLAIAQRPGGDSDVPASKSADVADFVGRMLASDKDKDGSLTRSEVGDTRLVRLFELADADKDGIVTKGELTALAEKEYVEPRGGFGGPGGGPPGGPGGPGGGFGPPMGRPGEILPMMLQQRLNLSSEQKSQVAALQKDVDEKLAKILNDEQNKQLKDFRDRGPGGGPGGRRGGPGGPGGGPGGPGGRPPGGGNP